MHIIIILKKRGIESLIIESLIPMKFNWQHIELLYTLTFSEFAFEIILHLSLLYRIFLFRFFFNL